MTHLALIASAILIAPSAMAQVTDHSAHEGHTPPAEQQPAKPAEDHSAHAGHEQMDHSKMDHGNMNRGADAPHTMTSAFSSYASTRDASGTSWVPNASTHGGVHATAGDWMLMGHATLDGVYSWQDGPRGDEKLFAAGMIMGTA